MYGAGFAQKIELGWKSFLCGSLRISVFSALMGLFNAEGPRDTQRPQINKSDLPLFVQSLWRYSFVWYAMLNVLTRTSTYNT